MKWQRGLMVDQDKMHLTGVVTDVNRDVILVKVKNGESYVTVQGYPAGNLRKNSIMILMGDTVDIEISPYDLTRGRITYRHKLVK
jgi:translation initiation factor IF-1